MNDARSGNNAKQKPPTKAEMRDALITLLGAIDRQVNTWSSLNVDSARDHASYVLGRPTDEEVDAVMARTIGASPRNEVNPDSPRKAS